MAVAYQAMATNTHRTFQGRMYLLVTDAHLKWPKIVKMRNTTAIKELQKIYASYGLPKQIVSDNGPQFISQKLANFIKINGIEHIKSAPYYLSTNGAGCCLKYCKSCHEEG